MAVHLIDAPWRDPLDVLASLAETPWTMGFLSGDQPTGWSYVMTDPSATAQVGAESREDPFQTLAELAGPVRTRAADGPPFQGGVAGLAGYELAGRVERIDLPRLGDWPDLACARYDKVLAFDHRRRRCFAVGRGDGAVAEGAARCALDWLGRRPGGTAWRGGNILSEDASAYEAAVAEVIVRIHAGEIFQANIARRWRGRLHGPGRPFDLLAALTRSSPAPFATYVRLPGKAIVSNSPERFVEVARAGRALVVRTQPIKGTAPRGRTADEDAALRDALLASNKDRAENLMIVDLMRNDLARVCTPGSVRAPQMFEVQSFANVHHLVSTVTGTLGDEATAIDLLRAVFPAGSITGAPKIQAMKVVSALEGARGPFFGSAFWLGADGTLDSNVLIRTAACVEDFAGWEVEVRAGAGIVADSSPRAERQETETKVTALLAAMNFSPKPET